MSRQDLQRKVRKRFGELPKTTEIHTFRDVLVAVGMANTTDNTYAEAGAALLDVADPPKPRGRRPGSGVKYPTAQEFFKGEIQAKLNIAERGDAMTKLNIAVEMGLSESAYHYKQKSFLKPER